MLVLTENKKKFEDYQKRLEATILELQKDEDEEIREMYKNYKLPQTISDIFCPYQKWLDNLTDEDKEKYKIVPDENRDFTGIYVCGGHNDHYKIDYTTDFEEDKRANYDYGVVDNATQVLDNAELPEKGVVLMCPVFNEHDGPCGWRWHKWGPYYGVQNPQCEYLSSEENIEMIYCFKTVIFK